MVRKRRRFHRQIDTRSYRKLFVVAVEGEKTEPQYFTLFNDQHSTISVKCLKSKFDSSPLHVLKRMKTHLRREELRKTDEAWLLVDKDLWTEDQLKQLYDWSTASDNYGFGLSNPKFEYWLLLHFEEGTGFATASECTERLKRHLPSFDKGIDSRKFTRQMITDAVQRAKARDNPACIDWPRNFGSTTVYRLIERIIQAQES